MSTRCITIFKDDDQIVATIYRHSDGYPDGMGADIKSFIIREKQADYDDLITLMAANFVACMNNNHANTVELYPAINYETYNDIIEYMEDTDWEYVYIVEGGYKKPIILTILDCKKILFSDVPEKLEFDENGNPIKTKVDLDIDKKDELNGNEQNCQKCEQALLSLNEICADMDIRKKKFLDEIWHILEQRIKEGWAIIQLAEILKTNGANIDAIELNAYIVRKLSRK